MHFIFMLFRNFFMFFQIMPLFFHDKIFYSCYNFFWTLIFQFSKRQLCRSIVLSAKADFRNFNVRKPVMITKKQGMEESG